MRLDALEVPDSLIELRERVAAMLPRVDLPELLLEVHAWTGFLSAYTRRSPRPALLLTGRRDGATAAATPSAAASGRSVDVSGGYWQA